METLLEGRLSALTTEINKIKQEIKDKTKFNDESFQQAWSDLDVAPLDSLLALAPPPGQYRPFESTAGSSIGSRGRPNRENISDFYWGHDGFTSRRSSKDDEGPLDLKQLKDTDDYDGALEQVYGDDGNDDLDLKELLECVQDAVSVTTTPKDEATTTDTDNLDDLLNLVTRAIEPASAVNSNLHLSGKQGGSLHFANKSQNHLHTNTNYSKRWNNTSRTTYNSYQVPRLQYNPIDEEGDTLMESAARSIQNKYLHIAPEDQSIYQADSYHHAIKDENDLSLASMEYLKRHHLANNPSNPLFSASSASNLNLDQPVSSSRQKRLQNPGDTSRFLDLEKLGRLKKLT